MGVSRGWLARVSVGCRPAGSSIGRTLARTIALRAGIRTILRFSGCDFGHGTDVRRLDAIRRDSVWTEFIQTKNTIWKRCRRKPWGPRRVGAIHQTRTGRCRQCSRRASRGRCAPWGRRRARRRVESTQAVEYVGGRRKPRDPRRPKGRCRTYSRRRTQARAPGLTGARPSYGVGAIHRTRAGRRVAAGHAAGTGHAVGEPCGVATGQDAGSDRRGPLGWRSCGAGAIRTTRAGHRVAADHAAGAGHAAGEPRGVATGHGAGSSRRHPRVPAPADPRRRPSGRRRP